MERLSVKPETYDRLTINTDQLEEFCQRRHIIELALFGSVLRDDFRPDSDIDILITFTPNVKISLLDLVDMQYDPEVDAIRITLKDTEIEESGEEIPGIILDFDGSRQRRQHRNSSSLSAYRQPSSHRIYDYSIRDRCLSTVSAFGCQSSFTT